jgi:hypothetical protein
MIPGFRPKRCSCSGRLLAKTGIRAAPSFLGLPQPCGSSSSIGLPSDIMLSGTLRWNETPKRTRTVRRATELALSFVTTAQTVASLSSKSANASPNYRGTPSTILALNRRPSQSRPSPIAPVLTQLRPLGGATGTPCKARQKPLAAAFASRQAALIVT